MARKSRKNILPMPEPQAPARLVQDAGAYVRLSAVDRKKKGDSIETQQAIINTFIDEHPDLVLREVYIDNGTTGQTFKRPAFQRMLADAENGKISCLVTKDLSRLGRNAIDTGYYIEKYFPAHGLRFIAINDGYDSDNGQTGSMMVSLKNIVNETYALEIGRKIRATKQMNIREGAFVGRLPPYGYLKSSTDGHKLVVDGEAAPIIRQMYEMAAERSAVSAIVKYLNDAGILPPKRYFCQKGLVSEKEASGHIHWNSGAIYSILHNRVYQGDMVQGKFRTTDHVEKLLPASEWVVTENTHEPIVSRELWARVQKRWTEKPRKERVAYSENIFRGKLFCAHCGYAMRRTRFGKNHFGFICETRRIYDKSDCVSVSISENELREGFLKLARKQVDVFVERPVEPPKLDNTELLGIRREFDKITGYSMGLYESLVLGDITAEEYRDMKQRYEDKIAELTWRERQMREEAVEQAIQSAERGKASGCMAALRSPDDLTAEMIEALAERIDICSDKEIKLRFRFVSETGTTEEASGNG